MSSNELRVYAASDLNQNDNEGDLEMANGKLDGKVAITDEAQVLEMVKTVQSKFGRVDILVNNAGVSLNGPISGADPEDWRRMVNTDILGMLYGIHGALPIMKAQGSGHMSML